MEICEKCVFYIEECDKQGICTKDNNYISVDREKESCNDFVISGNEDEIDDYLLNEDNYY